MIWNGQVQSDENCMKRRTLRQLRAKLRPEPHHNVYVVLLKPAVGKIPGLMPEERFSNHKTGIKAAAVVTRYGLGLLPEF